MFGFYTKNLIFLLFLLSFTTSCFKGKFEFKMAPKKGVTEVEEKKFKLSFYDPAGKNTYCPNIHAIFAANTPKQATQYCLSDSSDSSQACVWKSLPMDIKFKATAEGQKIVKYLHFRNDEFEIVDQIWESNELEIKASSIAKTDAERITQLRTDELTEIQMDEYLCRLDEWSFNVTKNIAMNPSDSFTKERRLIMNQQLSRMYYDEFPFTAKMSKDEISKAGWRLLTFSQEPIKMDKTKYAKITTEMRTIYTLPDSLVGMDVSFIQFKNRNVSYLNFKGTNLRGYQLNEIDPISYQFGVSGLDLKNWTPQNIKNVEGVDFSYASNIPWSKINQLTTLNSLNLSGLNLSEWKPSPSIVDLNHFKMSNVLSIPFDYFNQIISASSAGTDLSLNDLANWKPAPTFCMSYYNFSESKNLPWSYINANTCGTGFAAVDFSKVDLNGWSPSSSAIISSINYQEATNIPWPQLTSNTHSWGIRASNFENLDLKNFSPPSTLNISRVNFKGCRNIPWAHLNANTNTSGFMAVNFEGHDLSQWKPSTTVPVGALLYNTTNIPWDLMNANTSSLNFLYMDVTGVDLKNWSPGPTSAIAGIRYTNASNIPWEKLNANTNVNGFSSSNFSGTDLSQWSPAPSSLIEKTTFSGAQNIPWDKINANTHANGHTYSDFTGLDLSGFKPSPTTKFFQTIFIGVKNMPWKEINANTNSAPLHGVVFSKLDLSNLNHPAVILAVLNLYKARNIPWQKLSQVTSVSYNFQISYYDDFNYLTVKYGGPVNYEGFVPKHGLKVNSQSPGSFGKYDFEELTESSNFRGVQWWDNSYPWGF